MTYEKTMHTPKINTIRMKRMMTATVIPMVLLSSDDDLAGLAETEKERQAHVHPERRKSMFDLT